MGIVYPYPLLNDFSKRYPKKVNSQRHSQSLSSGSSSIKLLTAQSTVLQGEEGSQGSLTSLAEILPLLHPTIAPKLTSQTSSSLKCWNTWTNDTKIRET